MTAPARDRAVLRRAPARIAQLDRVYVSKAGQTGQTGQHVENKQELSAISGRNARSYDPKLASRTVYWPIPAACAVSMPIASARGHPSRGARSP
jgi:hypothetical protein